MAIATTATPWAGVEESYQRPQQEEHHPFWEEIKP
jgi:hypothetical protein